MNIPLHKKISLPKRVLLIYAILLYGLWSLLEMYLKTRVGVDEFTKEVYIKTALWLIPAVLLHLRFSDSMFLKKEMYSLNRSCWIAVPIMILFTVYILISEYLADGQLAISESFGISTVVMVLSIGMGEEMVFRGLFLNAMLKDGKKCPAVFINALLFFAIHFPIWIQGGSLVSVFTGGGFISVLLVSCIFSAVFIRTKSIWTAFFLHFWWDLLLFLL